MEKENIKKWVKALRSGRFAQDRGVLQGRRGFCCLGVACKIFIKPRMQTLDSADRLEGVLPDDQPHTPYWLKHINEDFLALHGLELTELNDIKHFSFDEIADLLEITFIYNAFPEDEND